MRRLSLLLVAGASFFGVAGVAAAQAPAPIFAHQHFLVLPDGTALPVGPDICSNEAAAQGFYGFHQNIHAGTPNRSAFTQPGNPVAFKAIPRCP